jgi:hypothetical protein
MTKTPPGLAEAAPKVGRNPLPAPVHQPRSLMSE